MFNNIMIGAFAVGFIITSVMVCFTLTRMKNDKREYFVLFMFCCTLFFLGVIIEMSASTSDGGLFGVQTGYIGSALSAPVYLVFVQKYCEKKLPKWVNLLIFASAFCIIGLVWTSRFHTLFYTSMWYDAESPVHNLAVTRGVLYPLGKIHPVICMALTVMVLSWSMRGADNIKRKRLLILLYGATAPAVSQLLTLFGFNIYGYGDFSLLFIISGMLVIYFGLAKYDLLENEETIRIKKAFLRDMSHEMKAPLTVIATGIDYADMQIKNNDGGLSKACDALETAREETQRLGRMVNGMVSLAAMSVTGENRKRANFAALISNSAEALRLVLEQQNNILTVELASGLPDVFIESDRFTQVIENLLVSSARHTKDGEITVKADFNDGYITVCVTDTGGGIQADMLCKTVVEAHGGTIKTQNETDRGTAVRFTVPVYGGQEAGHSL